METKPANERQVGGAHYQGTAVQHWDIVAQHNLDYFQGQITKYVMRWRKKGGLQDLEKAKHFLEKYIEVEKEKTSYPGKIMHLAPGLDREAAKPVSPTSGNLPDPHDAIPQCGNKSPGEPRFCKFPLEHAGPHSDGILGWR